MAQAPSYPLPPVPAPAQVEQVFNDNSTDLALSIFVSVGGSLATIERYPGSRNTMDDILYSIWKRLVGQPVGGTGTTGTRLIYGYVSWSGTGLTYDVTATIFYLNSILLSTTARQITLAPADPVNDRFDVVYLGAGDVVGVITGQPAPNPVKPVTDPVTQLELSFIRVKAGALVPADVLVTDIYQEHQAGEWMPFRFGVSTSDTFDSLLNPQSGVKCIKTGYLSEGEPIGFYYAPGITFADYDFLKFWIRIDPRTGNETQFSLDLYWVKDNVKVTEIYNLRAGYQLDENFDGWQLITIPIAAFPQYNTQADTLYFQWVSATWPGGISLDNITLQGGTPAPITGGGTVTPTVRVEAKVGGITSVTGTVATVNGLTDGSTSIDCVAFAGKRVNVVINGYSLPGFDLENETIFYTKTIGSNTINIPQGIYSNDHIKIETLTD